MQWDTSDHDSREGLGERVHLIHMRDDATRRLRARFVVKELRVAGACTLEQANRVLEEVFLPWWEATCTVEPAHPDDAHRPWAGPTTWMRSSAS